MTSVAIIFDNFGPYHIARLRAAAGVCDLLAIEVAGQSATYAWEKVSAAASFKRVTLIEQATSEDVSRPEIVRRLSESLDSFQPQVVVVPGWASAAAWGAMLWCVRRGVPMVMMSESTSWDEPRATWKEAIKRRLIGLCVTALVGGQCHRDNLVALGMPAERIFLGYDVVDNDFFSGKAEVAVRGNLPPHYFLASARFVEKKNLPRLLEAYALYRKSCGMAEPWSLVLLGDGPLRSALEEKRVALGLSESVVMPGFVQIDDLPAYYAFAGAFVHASTIEPWGLVVNEAMACRLPVLVSNRCGCAPELVGEGVNGFTFDPLNVEEIAGRMREVSAPEFPLQAFGQGSARIIAQWGPERFAHGLAAAIASAVKLGPVRSTWLGRTLPSILLRR